MMLSILEYSDVGSTQRGSLPHALEPPVAIQSIEISPNSIQSEPMAASTAIVKLSASIDCVIALGIDPDATDSTRAVKAGVEQTLAVQPGKGMRVAVRASGSAIGGTGMDSLEALLKLIASPAEVGKQLDALSKATAEYTAAAQGHNDAVAAAAKAGTLAEWEEGLVKREAIVVAQKAILDEKLDGIRELAARKIERVGRMNEAFK